MDKESAEKYKALGGPVCKTCGFPTFIEYDEWICVACDRVWGPVLKPHEFIFDCICGMDDSMCMCDICDVPTCGKPEDDPVHRV